MTAQTATNALAEIAYWLAELRAVELMRSAFHNIIELSVHVLLSIKEIHTLNVHWFHAIMYPLRNAIKTTIVHLIAPVTTENVLILAA